MCCFSLFLLKNYIFWEIHFIWFSYLLAIDYFILLIHLFAVIGDLYTFFVLYTFWIWNPLFCAHASLPSWCMEVLSRYFLQNLLFISYTILLLYVFFSTSIIYSVLYVSILNCLLNYFLILFSIFKSMGFPLHRAK